MEKKTLEQMVKEMSEEEVRLNLLYLTRYVEEGARMTPELFLRIFDMSWDCVHYSNCPME